MSDENRTTLGAGMSDDEQERISRACNPPTLFPETAAEEHDRYVAAENFVRDCLRRMGLHDDADNPRLVGRVASKILRAMPLWTHPDLQLRSSDEEIEIGKR